MGVLGRKALPLLGIAGVALLAAAQPARADICDLTSTTQCTINGGIFTKGLTHDTSGLNPFLSLQANNTAQGYNTNARSYSSKTQFNELQPLNVTHNLLASDVGTKTIDGKKYKEFFLDVDSSWSGNPTTYLITLDQLEIYVSNTPDLNKYSNSSGGNNASGSLSKIGVSNSNALKIYDLDTNSKDNWVNLNFVIGGNGNKDKSDMSFLLDAALFGDYQYVYLYSQFGDATPDDKDSKGKVKNDYKYPTKSVKTEEWFTDKDKLPPPPSVPEPGAVLLLGVGLAFAARRLRKA